MSKTNIIILRDFNTTNLNNNDVHELKMQAVNKLNCIKMDIMNIK